MWQRLVSLFLLSVFAYFIVRIFAKETFTSWVETPARATAVGKPPIYGEHAIAASGPNPPAAAPPAAMPTIMSPEAGARDPYDDQFEHADAPEQMRYPERSFGPGIVPEATQFAESSGVAGDVGQSSQAFQQFGPDMVQNGAIFGNVVPMEDENPNYSAF